MWAACSGSSSTSVQPTTGILIRAETLTTGRGCGTGPTQLFRYAVVVFGYTEDPPNLPVEDRASYRREVTSNVFDCFTDGAFIELPPSAQSGNSSFRLEVYAYSEPVYTAFKSQIESANTDTSVLKKTSPTWTTECTASQQRDVQTLALCDPLGAGLTGVGGNAGTTQITLGTTSFRLADGRTALCANGSDAGAPADAAVDADADAASDADASDASADADAAEAAAPVDAGAPVFFSTVRIRYRTSTAIGPTTDLTCPSPFVAEVSQNPAHYDIDVGVLDATQAPLGTTTCSVTTKTGTTSTADCP